MYLIIDPGYGHQEIVNTEKAVLAYLKDHDCDPDGEFEGDSGTVRVFKIEREVKWTLTTKYALVSK